MLYRSFKKTLLLLISLFSFTECGSGEERETSQFFNTQTVSTPKFIFPIQGFSVRDITKNTVDPRKDGWWVGNFFGHWCEGACLDNVGYHPGEDWNMRCKDGGSTCDEGEPVYAAGDGVVTYAQTYRDGSVGKAVVILHTLPVPEDASRYILPETTIPEKDRMITQVETAYMHLKNLTVRAGESIKLGEKIGEIAPFNGPHLHFEVRWKTGNLTYFPDYKPTHQALTDRGLLVPTAFISAHTETPFVFVPMEGWNPLVCKNQPTKSDIDSSLVCQKTTAAPLGATIWGAVQLDRMRRTTCLSAAFLKDGLYQYSSPATCLTASDTAIRERTVFWTRTIPPTVGTWRIDYLTGETEYSLKKLTESTFVVNTTNTTPPPPPPRPLDQTFYVFAGVKLTCDRPLAREIWGDYRCDGNRITIPSGQNIYGMVKIHYLAPSVRYRFIHELYWNGTLVTTLDDHVWQNSGSYGQGEVYNFPRVATDTLGRVPDNGTWTVRSFIAIDGKFTNWITDQTVTVF